MRVKGRGKIGGWHRFPFIIPATCGTSTGRSRESLIHDPQWLRPQCSKLDQSFLFFLFLFQVDTVFVRDLVACPQCAGFVGDNNCIGWQCPCLSAIVKMNGLIAPVRALAICKFGSYNYT